MSDQIREALEEEDEGKAAYLMHILTRAARLAPNKNEGE